MEKNKGWACRSRPHFKTITVRACVQLRSVRETLSVMLDKQELTCADIVLRNLQYWY